MALSSRCLCLLGLAAQAHSFDLQPSAAQQYARSFESYSSSAEGKDGQPHSVYESDEAFTTNEGGKTQTHAMHTECFDGRCSEQTSEPNGDIGVPNERVQPVDFEGAFGGLRDKLVGRTLDGPGLHSAGLDGTTVSKAEGATRDGNLASGATKAPAAPAMDGLFAGRGVAAPEDMQQVAAAEDADEEEEDDLDRLRLRGGGGAAALEQPKKPMSAYFVFMQANREKVVKEIGSKAVPDVAKAIKERWDKLSESEKKTHEKKAADLKAQYEKDLAAFVKAGGEVGAARKENKAAKDKRAAKKARKEDKDE